MSNNQNVLQFEKELINKIEQKQLPNSNAEQTLIKYFKYFDIENKGICGLRDWIKALEKLGVQFHKASEIQEIFSNYENDKKGLIDYKAFAKQICSNYNQDTDNLQNQEGLNKLNGILTERGGAGLLDLYKEFKIFDVNNFKRVSIDDFIKCISNHNLGLSVNEIQSLFNTYENTTNGQFFYEDMFQDLRKMYWNNERDSLIDEFVDKHDLKSYVELKDKFIGEDKESFIDFVDSFNFIKSLKNQKDIDEIYVIKEFFSFFCFGVTDNTEIESFLKANFDEKLKSKKSSKKGNSMNYNLNSNNDTNLQDQKRNSERSYSLINDKAKSDQNFRKDVEKNLKSSSSYELDKLVSKLKTLSRKNIFTLLKTFKYYDNDTKFLNKVDFTKLLKDIRINFTPTEIDNLFEEFTDSKTRLLNHKTFLDNFILQNLTETTNRLIKETFSQLLASCGKQSGETLDFNKIKLLYKGSSENPFFESSEKELFNDFFTCLDLYVNSYLYNKSVSEKAFIDFYKILNLSLNFDEESLIICLYNDWGNSDSKEIVYDVNENVNNIQGGNINNEKSLRKMQKSTKNHDSVFEKNNDLKIPKGKPGFQLRNKSSLIIGGEGDEIVVPSSKENTNNKNSFGLEEKKKALSKSLNKSINVPKYNSGATNIDLQSTSNQVFNIKYNNDVNNNNNKQEIKYDSRRNSREKSDLTPNKYSLNKKEATPTNSSSPLELLISKLRNRGIRGLMHFHKEFLNLNITKITLTDFIRTFKLQKINIDKSIISEIFNKFSTDKKFLNFQSLFTNFKKPLTGNSLSIIEEAFSTLDKEESGVVILDDVRLAFIPNKHFGDNLELVGLEFIDTFELGLSMLNSQNTENDNTLITFQEFANYFEYVRFALDEEEIFVRAVRDAFSL